MSDKEPRTRAGRAIIRMLFFPAETYPTDRVRLTSLFERELIGRGHEIDLVMQARDDSVPSGRHDIGVRPVWVGPTDSGSGIVNRIRKHALGIWHDLRWLWGARYSRYDCILVSDKFALASIAVILARWRGIKVFFWLTFAFHKSHVLLGREGLVRYPMLSVIRGHVAKILLYRWIIPRSDHVFVQSQRMAQDFCEHGADPRKLTPVVTGIDAAEILPKVHSRSSVSGSRTITLGYLGTLGRERRLEILVDMLVELGRRGIDARLLLVGDGEVPEDRLAIERRAQIGGVGNRIEITGLLPRLLALDRMREADICLSPIYPSPIFDGASPTKLVEYLALGIPVVANVHPDQSLVLQESRAGLCVPWGARHFARAVGCLARRGEGELQNIGHRGRQWVEQYRSYALIADQFERACLDAIAETAARAT